MRDLFFPVYLAALALIANVGISQYAAAQTPDLVAQGRQAIAAEKFDEALAIFEKAVAADPNNAAALAWLGNAQVRKTATVSLFERPSWVKKGMDTLDQAVKRFPDDAIVYVVRGMTAARLPAMFAKAPLAIKDLNTAIAMREKNAAAVSDSAMPGVYLALGLAYKQDEKSDEARAAWEKGRALYPSASEAAAMANELKNLWQPRTAP